MTAKRYRKLLGALISKIMQGNDGAGQCIRAARCARPPEKTYSEAWEGLKQIRKEYGM